MRSGATATGKSVFTNHRHDDHRGKKAGKSSTSNKTAKCGRTAKHHVCTKACKRENKENNNYASCGVTDCDHEACTQFGHFHRPSGLTGAARRAAENKTGKKSKKKPARWTMCQKHLTASDCGIDKPHGHCNCDATAHFVGMLEEYSEQVLTPSSGIERETLSDQEFAEMLDEKNEENAAYGKSNTARTYPDMDAYMDEYYHNEKKAELTATFNDLNFILMDHKLKCQTDSTLPTVSEEPSSTPKVTSGSVDGDAGDSLPPATSEIEAPAKHADAVDFNTPKEGVPTISVENKESLTTATPKTHQMFVFLNLPVGDENLTLRDKLSNWWKKKSLFTRVDTTTLVNLPSDHIFPEHIDVRRTSDKEVKRVWRRACDPGKILAQKPGNFSIFRKLLPACLEVSVYTDLYKAAVSDSRLRAASVIVGGDTPQISRALDPTVTKRVEELRMETAGTFNDTTLLTWTCIAVMNQLTAQAVFRKLATTSKELDFRTGGQSRTKRFPRPPTSLAPKRSKNKIC